MKRKQQQKSLRTLLKCIKKVTQKVKRKHRGTQKIIHKIKHNAKLDAPKVIVNMYNGMLKRPKQYTDLQLKIAKRLLHKAKHNLSENNKKKHKSISKKEINTYKEDSRELRNDIQKQSHN